MPGHWEGDLIMGAANRSAVITLVERTSRFLILQRVPYDHNADRIAVLLAGPWAGYRPCCAGR